MESIDKAIHFDFADGTISGGSPVERAGLELMRIAAWMTRPADFCGFSYAAKIVRTVLPGRQPVVTQLTSDAVFEFPYGDAYWSRLLYNRVTYCPEIERFLMAMRDVDYLFIDCGANYGYMSAIVASDAYGNKPAISIEADPGTFSILQKNADHNNHRFEIRHNAVFSRSGETVNLYGAKHEARSIIPDEGGATGGIVETLALDDVTKGFSKKGSKPVILKLDVEGVEIEAMKGAGRLQTGDCLVVFEDHGSDPTHEVSKYFLEDLEMRLFDPASDGCPEITSLDELDAIKKNSRVGYDFIATKSSFWLDHIAAYSSDKIAA